MSEELKDIYSQYGLSETGAELAGDDIKKLNLEDIIVETLEIESENANFDSEMESDDIPKRTEIKPKRKFKMPSLPHIDFKACLKKLKALPLWAYIAAGIIAATALACVFYFCFTYRYIVDIDGTSYKTWSFSQDADSAVKKVDTGYNKDSHIETSKNGRVITVSVTHPFDVVFSYDGKKQTVTTTGDTVENLLPTKLNENDIISVPLDKEITGPKKIAITRVTTKKRTVEQTIPAPIDDQSGGAKKTVTKPGVDGLDLVTYLDTYHNNILMKSEEIARKTVTEAQAAVILSLEYNGDIPDMKEAPKKYKEILSVECTAYCMPGNHTATGKLAMVGYVAVDPEVIPYHTKMFICSPDGSLIYGYAQAEDCGGGIKGNRIDLYFNTEEECQKFGRRQMIAYILEDQ